MKGLYVIIDPEHCRGRDPRLVCRQALEGGAALIQLRAKRLTDTALLGLARELAALCADHGVSFWLNDRLDIALLARANGLHLGQDDLRPADVRQLAANLALGLSTHSLEQVEAARAQPVSLIGFGPVFETSSKERPSPRVGLLQLAAACRAAPELDLVAIGGIQLQHARDIARSGAAYAAVISAVCGADDPRAAARALSDALHAA
ncbi:MAG TPA: thiamine phosphate synthase [Polyangiales bacterium]